MEILNATFFGNAVLNWIIAAIAAVVIFGFIKGLLHILKSRIKARTDQHKGFAGDFVVTILTGKTSNLFIVIIALYGGLLLLNLPMNLTRIARGVTLVVIALQAGTWGNAVISYFIQKRAGGADQDANSLGAYAALNSLAKATLWALILLVALNNLGVNITALIAGLGIGGIAVALAAQNILGDLFASISIMLDKPFLVGDSISVDTYTGIVEHIGVKTTRIKSPSGEQVIFSNTDLLKSRVRNFKRMRERNVTFSININYQTPTEKLSGIPELLRGIIETIDGARFERAHLKELGKSALIYEVMYAVNEPDLRVYLDAQQSINLGILNRFKESGIDVVSCAA